MNIQPYNFSRKCDFGLCQNKGDFSLQLGAKGQLIMCKKHLSQLVEELVKFANIASPNKAISQDKTQKSKIANTVAKTAKFTTN